jgi:predicted nucleotide-binding protein
MAQPMLTAPRTEAAQKIQAQIEKGRGIRNAPINSQAALDDMEAERSKWSSYNTELLKRLFDSTSIADEYDHFGGAVIPGDAGLGWWINDFRRGMDTSITRLESILGRLELIPERSGGGSAQRDEASVSASVALGSDVFVVHGHDDAAKQSAARFIEKLGLRAVILHEQPNAGRTIIEKFEKFSNVGFAVVLLTPDDLCSAGSEAVQRARARQNVIFELGYFVGKLGRDRVCALYKEGVELPSDFQGVLFVPMDPHQGWHFLLAKEIKAAGIDIDLNKAI